MGGPRGLSPDEDEFTLAVTALERAMDRSDRGTTPIEVDLLADLPASMEWALPAAVGAPVRLLRSAASSRGFVDALHRAGDGSGGMALVVAVQLPPAEGPPERGGAASVAFLFGGSGRGDLSGRLDPLTDEGSAVRAAFALYRSIRAERAGGTGFGTWAGDWDEADVPGPVPDGPDRMPVAERATDLVSQGAYVPRPRYLENLPSRWRFVADRCAGCGNLTFPARGKCRACGRTDGLAPTELPRDGAGVVATTVIGPGGQPTEFDPQVEAWGPYEVVLAELAPGVRVTLQLTDAVPGEVRIGDRVDTRLRRLFPIEGEWRYGRKAVPQAARPAGAAGAFRPSEGGSHGAPTQLS